MKSVHKIIFIVGENLVSNTDIFEVTTKSKPISCKSS